MTQHTNRTSELFHERWHTQHVHADRVFRVLLIVEWIAGMLAAAWLTPQTWNGDVSRTHLHVWTAVVLGGAITWFPVFLSYRWPGSTLTRHVICAAQVLWSALLIHLTGGRIETHFHVFGSLAFIAFYRDWRVLMTASLVVAFDHAFRGVFFPRSIYGILTGGEWRFLEHAGWVVFCDFFLLISIEQSRRDMWLVARKYADLESQHGEASHEVLKQTESLRDVHTQLSAAGEQQLKYMAIVESSNDAIIGKDLQGIVTSWNAGAERIYGYSADEIVGKSILTIVPDDRHSEVAGFLESLAKRQPIRNHETQRVRRDGTTIEVSLSISPIVGSSGDVIGAATIARDISGRRESERRVVESEARHRAVFETAIDAIITINERGIVEAFNSAAEKSFGYSADEVIGRNINMLMPSPHRAQHDGYLARYLQTGEENVIGAGREVEARRKDGSLFPAELAVSVVHLDSRRLFTGFIRDLTARKRAEREVEDSEQRLNLAVRGTSDGLWDWDIATDEVWYSPRFVELLGFDDGEIEFRFSEWESRLHPDDRDETLAAVKRHLESDEAYDVEYRLKKKCGEWAWFRARGACVRNDEGWPVRMAGALQDISEHKRQSARLQEQDAKIQQKQKLEAVGSLAGGVAHEFNNLLQAIQGYTRFAQEGLDESEQRFQDLVQALKAADRAATLTSQLLCFSRADHYEAQPVEPDMLLDDLSKLLKPVIGERISVTITTKPDTPAVLADPAGLQQVLLNLCVNARDAMPDGGQLVVKAEAAKLSDGYCKLHGVDRPGKYVCFTVSDTGTGMSPEQADRIFEPFFTTKEVGKGTGLGLAMVHGFVERHDGLINVYSEPEEGTTFRIYIPLADECSMITPSDEPQITTGGDELLLVAEDEPMVRAVAERILKNAGYRVLTAVDGREAVKLFVEHQDQISLTLLDVVMPNMTGRQAYEAIREIDPDARAIFCTGYDPETSQAESFQQDSLMLVQKPYDPDELLRGVRQMIDEHPQSETLSCTH